MAPPPDVREAAYPLTVLDQQPPYLTPVDLSRTDARLGVIPSADIMALLTDSAFDINGLFADQRLLQTQGMSTTGLEASSSP